MGENITTRGLALLDLAPGTKLHLGESAVIEITGSATPARSSTPSTSGCSRRWR